MLFCSGRIQASEKFLRPDRSEACAAIGIEEKIYNPIKNVEKPEYKKNQINRTGVLHAYALIFSKTI
jgi:hypothetical protein